MMKKKKSRSRLKRQALSTPPAIRREGQADSDQIFCWHSKARTISGAALLRAGTFVDWLRAGVSGAHEGCLIKKDVSAGDARPARTNALKNFQAFGMVLLS